MTAVSNDEAEIGGVQLERPGADVIPLPQLERLPPQPGESPSSPHQSISGADGAGDSHSWRLEALELVRSAVELADRIEREAQHSAAERVARAEEEARLRRAALEERELELERARGELERTREQLDAARRDIELHRQQAIEAEQEAHALRARAEREAAEKIAIATDHAEAILQDAHREAQELAAAAQRQAEELAAAQRQAEELAAAQRQAEELAAAQRQAEELAAAQREAEELAAAQREAEKLLAQNQAPVDAGYDDGDAESGDPPQVEQGASEVEEPEAGYPAREPEASAEGESPMEEQAESSAETGEPELPSFTPPPLSVEDLATVSRLPILGKLKPRKR